MLGHSQGDHSPPCEIHPDISLTHHGSLSISYFLALLASQSTVIHYWTTVITWYVTDIMNINETN